MRTQWNIVDMGKKNEVVICAMNGTEDQSKPGIERWILPGTHTSGLLKSSSRGS